MLFKSFREEIDSILQRDPAARSRLEVILCYPGLHALVFHRLAAAVWRRGFRVLGRFISHIGKILTGVEIHPGATIGQRLFIDHATGVVIGETAEIGDDVTLYHGVTLGGTSLHKGKRHPTLENGVIVGAGAHVLGPIRIGEGARIGANAVVLADVPRGVTMAGIPARIVMRRSKKHEGGFFAYGVSDEHLPDPVARAVETLRGQINTLREKIEELEGKGGSSAAKPRVVAESGAEDAASEEEFPTPRAGRAGERGSAN